VNKEDVARYGLPTDLPEGVKKGIEVAKAEARARAEQARARAKEKALAKEAEAIAQAKENGAELPAVFLTQMELAAKASVHGPLSLYFEDQLLSRTDLLHACGPPSERNCCQCYLRIFLKPCHIRVSSFLPCCLVVLLLNSF
jgi:hypothetical protein